jgi:hypothetical protein
MVFDCERNCAMDRLPKLGALLFSLLLFTSAAGAQSGARRSAEQHDSAVSQGQTDSPDPDGDAPADREDFDEADIVLMRNQWFYGQREYPLGYIPGGARLAALDHLDQMLAFRKSLRQQMGLAIEETLEAFGGECRRSSALLSESPWTGDQTAH